jgi:hypothetical protein
METTRVKTMKMKTKKAEVKAWLALADLTKFNIASSIHGFKTLSNTYEAMRDIGYDAEEKEAIDKAYRDVNDLRAKLAAKQAGGKRTTRRRYRATKTRKGNRT